MRTVFITGGLHNFQSRETVGRKLTNLFKSIGHSTLLHQMKLHPILHIRTSMDGKPNSKFIKYMTSMPNSRKHPNNRIGSGNQQSKGRPYCQDLLFLYEYWRALLIGFVVCVGVNCKPVFKLFCEQVYLCWATCNEFCYWLRIWIRSAPLPCSCTFCRFHEPPICRLVFIKDWYWGRSPLFTYLSRFRNKNLVKLAIV